MEQIQRSGRRLKTILGILLALTPLIYTGIFLGSGPIAALRLPSPVQIDPSLISGSSAAILFFLGAMTPLVYWTAFLLLHKLAGEYAQGRVFTPTSSTRLKQIGLVLLMTDPVRAAQSALAGSVLGWLDLSDGQLIIDLGVGTSLVGFFVILVGRIFVIASELDEQQRLTI